MTDVVSPARDDESGLEGAEPAGAGGASASSGSRPQLVSLAAHVDPEPPSKPAALSPADELALMRAVAARDPAAEAALVRRVLGLVRARARVLSRSPADADDATQTALVEILRSAPNFRGDGSLAGWCERITIRATLRLQRRHDRAQTNIDAAVDPDHVGEAGPTPPLAEAIPGGAVEGYLAELSPDRHAALVLRHVLGLSVDEIAAEAGVSPNTIKDRLRMARRQVRQAIRQREVVTSIKGKLR